MPLPNARRAREYALKAAELVLREVEQAPEQRAARKLAAGAGNPRGGTKVLIVSPRDWAAHVQYEAVIAHGLRHRGADVEFLTCGGGLEVCDRANTYEAPPMPCRTCVKYVHAALDAHGFPRRSMRDYWVVDDAGAWPELDAMSIDELADVESHGYPLGRLTEVPTKWFLCAADLEDDPLAAPTARAMLRSARRILSSVERALDEIRPEVVLLLNGLFLFESIMWAVCRRRGIDVVTYERAFVKETLVFHRGAPAGFYDFSAEWDRARRPLRESEEHELDRYLAARRAGQAADQFWTPKDTTVGGGSGQMVVAFTNLTWDTAVIGRDRAFPDIRAWLDAAIAAFASRPNVQLVLRIHPSEVHLPGKRTRDSLEEYVHRAHPDLSRNITVVGAGDASSSYPLMDACTAGLVYTSTTGLELALAGKPVIVAGATHYRGKGFTTDVRDRDEFERALTQALRDPMSMSPEVRLAREYAHFFFFRAPIRAPGVTEPVPGLARITVKTIDDLAPGHDEALDRICEGILSGASFVLA